MWLMDVCKVLEGVSVCREKVRIQGTLVRPRLGDPCLLKHVV